jgi:hypothetical protein
MGRKQDKTVRSDKLQYLVGNVYFVKWDTTAREVKTSLGS